MRRLLDYFRQYKDLDTAKEDFFKARQPKIADATMESYRKTLTPFVAHLGKGKNVRRITLGDLLEYAAAHLYRDDLAPRTTNRRVKEIQAFFNWMVRVGYLEDSPAKHLERVRLPEKDNEDKPIPMEHLQILLDRFYHRRIKRDICRYAILVFMADTGCRIGGAATLRMGNLKIQERWAKVHHKGRKLDKVCFGEACAHALNDWLLKRGHRDHDFVFCHSQGPYKANNISLFIRRACRELDIPDYSGHRFRYAFAQRLQDFDIDDEVIAAALGDTLIVAREHYLKDMIKPAVAEATRSVAIPVRSDRKIRMIK